MGNQWVSFREFSRLSSRSLRRGEEASGGDCERAVRPFLYLAASRTDEEKSVREVIERDRIEVAGRFQHLDKESNSRAVDVSHVG